MSAVEQRAAARAYEDVWTVPRTGLVEFAELAFADFELHRAALGRVLAEAVAEQAQRMPAADAAPFAGPCMTAADAQHTLTSLATLETGSPALEGFLRMNDHERDSRELLKQRAIGLGHPLPLDRLAHDVGLGAFEIDVVVLCAAAEIDRGYGRLFGFVLDNLNRQSPCVELLCALGTPGVRERLARRRALGAHGRLRRCGLIIATDNAERPLHTTLSVDPAVFRRITQPGPWSDRFFDPDVVPARAVHLELFEHQPELRTLAAGMDTGSIEVCGIWGSHEHGVDEAVQAIAAALNRPLFRVLADPAELDALLAAAEDRHGVLWVRSEDAAESPPSAELGRERLVARLARSALPVCCSGEYPWRPTGLLAARGYAELRLRAAPASARVRRWMRAFGQLDERSARDLAARYRLDPLEMRAVARTARTREALVGEAPRAPLEMRLNDACVQVTQRHGMRFTRLVEPRRGPADLVLPHPLHGQVLEIERFYRHLLHDDGHWGFGRIATGGGGLKVLFTGESGTGKTLAAEVIAGQLGLGLMKADLSRLVSKWLGETEKNLECVFREAEDSHAVLFFDEADTVCGKRGEISRGSDRYANLEVGYLLQRLEQYAGLVVLATNLGDEMDSAFVRRFHRVLHFPRPGEAERRRLWRIAIPAAAPLEAGIDLDSLVKLDMTGASIAGAARMAALLAADEASECIRESHLREGIRRQYQQEARLLNEDALAPLERAKKPWR